MVQGFGLLSHPKPRPISATHCTSVARPPLKFATHWSFDGEEGYTINVYIYIYMIIYVYAYCMMWLLHLFYILCVTSFAVVFLLVMCEAAKRSLLQDAKTGSPLEFENLQQWQVILMRGESASQRHRSTRFDDRLS